MKNTVVSNEEEEKNICINEFQIYFKSRLQSAIISKQTNPTTHREHSVSVVGMEGNVLFNDALNTFYLWLYGVRYMVKDHSDSEKGNPLPPHGLLFLINSKVLLYAPSHRQDSTYHSHGALAGTRYSSMGPPP